MIKWIKSKFHKPKPVVVEEKVEPATTNHIPVPTLLPYVWVLHSLRIYPNGTAQAWWNAFPSEQQAFCAYKKRTEMYPAVAHVVQKTTILEGNPGAVWDPKLAGYND